MCGFLPCWSDAVVVVYTLRLCARFACDCVLFVTSAVSRGCDLCGAMHRAQVQRALCGVRGGVACGLWFVVVPNDVRVIVFSPAQMHARTLITTTRVAHKTIPMRHNARLQGLRPALRPHTRAQHVRRTRTEHQQQRQSHTNTLAQALLGLKTTEFRTTTHIIATSKSQHRGNQPQHQPQHPRRRQTRPVTDFSATVPLDFVAFSLLFLALRMTSSESHHNHNHHTRKSDFK